MDVIFHVSGLKWGDAVALETMAWGEGSWNALKEIPTCWNPSDHIPVDPHCRHTGHIVSVPHILCKEVNDLWGEK